MEAFLHLSLGSSLCGESDNLVRSARKITHADKEHHLHIKKKQNKNTQKNCRTGRNVKSKACTTGTHTHTHTLVHKRADHSLVEVTRLWKSEGQSDWLSKTPDGLFI